MTPGAYMSPEAVALLKSLKEAEAVPPTPDTIAAYRAEAKAAFLPGPGAPGAMAPATGAEPRCSS